MYMRFTLEMLMSGFHGDMLFMILSQLLTNRMMTLSPVSGNVYKNTKIYFVGNLTARVCRVSFRKYHKGGQNTT